MTATAEQIEAATCLICGEEFATPWEAQTTNHPCVDPLSRQIATAIDEYEEETTVSQALRRGFVPERGSGAFSAGDSIAFTCSCHRGQFGIVTRIVRADMYEVTTQTQIEQFITSESLIRPYDFTPGQRVRVRQDENGAHVGRLGTVVHDHGGSTYRLDLDDHGSGWPFSRNELEPV